VVNAIKQTADAMTEVQSLAAQRAQQQDAVVSAQRAYDVARERYRSGLDTQLPMLTAESTLLQARQQLAAVVSAGAQQRITLVLTTGGGFELPPESQTISDSQIAKQDNRHD
jgi:outer membrane protein TolC